MRSGTVTVYLRRGKAIVASHDRTIAGFWIEARAASFEGSVESPELARLCLEGLQQARIDVPTPPPRQKLEVPTYEVAGVKGWAAFTKGTRAVSLRQQGGEISVIPMANRGARRGFEFLVDHEIRCQPTPEALQEALAVTVALAS